MKANRILLKHGHLLDPASGLDANKDLLIAKGKLILPTEQVEDAEIIDCTGKTIVPAFVDMHVHLREPGLEHKETITTGLNAAFAGGYCAVACMPNTSPPIDNTSLVRDVQYRATNHPVELKVIAAATVGREGKQITEMGEMVKAGVVAFSDDGEAIQNALTVYRVLEYASMLNSFLIEHCEDKHLGGGSMHEGDVSTAIGLSTQPSIAEEIIAERDIRIAEYLNASLHLAHVSTAGTVEMIRRAKARKVKITAEATPHHLSLTDAEVATYDSNFKMNPPLRTKQDVEALQKALADGTIDCIATDHAPHTPEEKRRPFEEAPFGVIGLENAFATCYTYLVKTKKLSLSDLILRMSTNPARILGLQPPAIREGATAQLVILDTKKSYIVNPETFKSLGRNCPYVGRELTGYIVDTILGEAIASKYFI